MLKKWWNFQKIWNFKFSKQNLSFSGILFFFKIIFFWKYSCFQLFKQLAGVFNKILKHDEFSNFHGNMKRNTHGYTIQMWRAAKEGNFNVELYNKVTCSTSSRRKPGWRFTAGSTYRTAVNWPEPVILVDIFMFLVIFCLRSYWFVTFRSFISCWSLILYD